MPMPQRKKALSSALAVPLPYAQPRAVNKVSWYCRAYLYFFFTPFLQSNLRHAA